jgi:hypothetical protein
MELDDFHIGQTVNFSGLLYLIITLPHAPIVPFDLPEGHPAKIANGRNRLRKGQFLVWVPRADLGQERYY